MKLLVLALLISLCIMTTPALAIYDYNPGLITPDNPLWVLDLKIEEIQERFAWNDEHRLKIQLRHMNERLGELQTCEKSNEVTQHYIDVIERIEGNTVRYEATMDIINELDKHRVILDGMGPNTSMVRNRIITSETAIGNNANQIIISEQKWWSSKINEYKIIDSPTPINNLGDFEKYTQQISEGITTIDVVRSDDILIQSFIVVKTDNECTIRTGTTENYAHKYTITIEQLKKYEVLL